jgi:hypothetical protein
MRAPEAAAAAPALIVDQCIEVEAKETFEVDVFVSDVSQLLAWDIYYAFNRDLVEVTGRNVHRMLEAAPNSNVLDVSDPLPNSSGLYRMGAADTGGANAAENGSGLLATITLLAKKEGVSWSALYRADVDRNGIMDIGPTLTALGGAHISDNDGDGIFDGAIRGGQIAVGTECAAVAPTPTVAPRVLAVVEDDSPATSPEASGDASADPGSGDAPEETGDSPEGATDGAASPTRARSVSLTNGEGPIPPRDGSGTSMATWLVGALAGSAGLGVVLTYFIYRTRRAV